jgi:hypothetical protein
MPCNVCHYFYAHDPCTKKEVVILDPITTHKCLTPYTESGMESLINVYNTLKENCLCYNCLVKTMCKTVCPEFQQSIKPVKLMV